MFISGEGAGGMSDGSILFGVAETDISVMHLPDESPYPVSRDECIVPVENGYPKPSFFVKIWMKNIECVMLEHIC